MKFLFKRGLQFAVLTSVFVLSFSTIAFAKQYSDVGVAHWAYQAVDVVSDKGIMVGDLEKKFHPDSMIDKFEASAVFAKMLGYKYTGLAQEETLYYDRCYDNNATLLQQYAQKFGQKWNGNYNKEIAFLLENQIYTQEDLDQFVVSNASTGAMQLRALSREETCAFMTRLMHKSGEAATSIPTPLFKDDTSISPTYRPYVYYFRNVGIVKGDPENNFLPKNGITRAQMAVMVEATMKVMDGSGTTTGKGTNTNTTTDSSGIQTIQGTIEQVFPNARALQIAIPNTDARIYMVSPMAAITVNGYVKTYNDLTAGLSVTGVLSGNELISVTAISGGSSANLGISDTTGEILIEAKITKVGMDTSGNTVTLETKTINPRGEIKTESTTYPVSSDAKIARGAAATTFVTVKPNDIGVFTVKGGKIIKIVLEEKDVQITGTLVEKTYNESAQIVSYVIKDNKNKAYTLNITSDTIIRRKGSGNVAWNELRVGDSVDVMAEYSNILDIYAVGSRSTVDTWVKDIHISPIFSYITGTTASNGGEETVYPIIAGLCDPYAFKMGSKIRMRLDSHEIESFEVLSDSKATSMTGIITNITRTTLTIKETGAGGYSLAKELTYDTNTVVIDSTTGKTSNINKLENDMKVFVVFGGSKGNYATTISILSYE